MYAWMRVCVSMYVFLCMYFYVFVCTCVCVCTCMHACLCACMHACNVMYVWMYIMGMCLWPLSTYKNMHTHTCRYVCRFACIHVIYMLYMLCYNMCIHFYYCAWPVSTSLKQMPEQQMSGNAVTFRSDAVKTKNGLLYFHVVFLTYITKNVYNNLY